jgi:hypothetical protein
MLFRHRRSSGHVALKRREVELALERPLDPGNPAAGAARLSARFELTGPGPTPAELAEALEGLKADLDALVGVPLAGVPGARADRELTELIETYRPRRRELIDALRDDGELTRGEHALLATYLTGIGAVPTPAAAQAPEPTFDRPIAAVPIAADRTSDRTADAGRPVETLLRDYQIASLKQAGAVRARREISFEEYMALKRHFQRDGVPDGPAAT